MYVSNRVRERSRTFSGTGADNAGPAGYTIPTGTFHKHANSNEIVVRIRNYPEIACMLPLSLYIPFYLSLYHTDLWSSGYSVGG